MLQPKGLFSGVSKYHARLSEHYSGLRANRGDFPVFAIEHGLNKEGRAELVAISGAAARMYGTSVDQWRDSYLPLLAAITEVGYNYQGTGTDFWPNLDKMLKVEFELADRENLSELFAIAHHEFGFRKPTDSPWVRAFHHIAWPISNSLAPLEIHRPLANTIRRCYQQGLGTRNETDLIQGLRSTASGYCSSRLVEWLNDGDTAIEVAKRLLSGSFWESWLSPEILERIYNDLSSDRSARRALKQAHRISPFGPRQGVVEETQFGRSRLRISLRELKLIRMFLVGPCLPVALRGALVSYMERSEIMMQCTLSDDLFDPERFFSGQLIDLGKPETEPEQPLIRIIGLSNKEDEKEMASKLARVEPWIDPPLLFQLSSTGEEADQLDISEILDPEKQYVLLTHPLIASGEEAVERLGPLLGLDAILLDATDHFARTHLESLGFKFSGDTRVELIGGLPLGVSEKGKVFAQGFPIMVRACPSKPLGVTVELQKNGETVRVSLDKENPVAIIDPVAGDYFLEVKNGYGSQQIEFSIVEYSIGENPLTVGFSSETPLADDFLRDDLVLRIQSPVALEGLEINAVLFCAGREVSHSSVIIDRLPAVFGPTSPLFKSMRDKLVDEAKLLRSFLQLRVTITDLWFGEWDLAWEQRKYEWEDKGGYWRAKGETIEVDVLSISADDPLVSSSPYPKNKTEEGVQLLLPDVPGDDQITSGLCVGTVVLGNQILVPRIPDQILREPDSRDGGVGFVPSLESYFSWVISKPTNLFADYVRRDVASAVEGAAVEQLCGTNWSRAEKACHATGGNYYESLLNVAMELQLARGADLPEIDNEDFPLLRRRLLFHFSSARIDFRSVEEGGLDYSGIAERLDFAVMDAYEDLRKNHQEMGAETFDEPDIANEPSLWCQAVNEAVVRHDMSFLEPMILPQNRWRKLRDVNYLTVTDDEIIDTLESCHVDISSRLGIRWLNRLDIRIGYQFWISPRRAIVSARWRETAIKLLSDRQSARAIRYAALRVRFVRQSCLTGGLMK